MAQQKKFLLTGLYSFIIIGSAFFYASQKNGFEINPQDKAAPPNNITKGKAIEASPSKMANKLTTLQGQEVAIEEM